MGVPPRVPINGTPLGIPYTIQYTLMRSVNKRSSRRQEIHYTSMHTYIYCIHWGKQQLYEVYTTLTTVQVHDMYEYVYCTGLLVH